MLCAAPTVLISIANAPAGLRKDVKEDELKQFARACLTRFKAPHSVRFVEELPKTATGKIETYILSGR